MRKRFITVLLLLVLAGGCAGAAETAKGSPPPVEPSFAPAPEPTPSSELPDTLEALVDALTLEEQVSQLFLLPLKSETGANITALTDETRAYLADTGAGGFILFKGNIDTREQLTALLRGIAPALDTPPLIAIDEEGGSVSRLSALDDYDKTPSARAIAREGVFAALHAGRQIGATLRALGIHLNCAPVADVLDIKNNIIGDRSFGEDETIVSALASAFLQGLHMEGVFGAPKHFPGHGATRGDPHKRAVEAAYTREEFRARAYAPFIRLIGEGARAVMVGHIRAPKAEESGLPASLSPYFVTQALRTELGFTGVVMTDSLSMGAITQGFTPEEAGVLALEAGADMLVMPQSYTRMKAGILEAINDGRLTRDRIRESVLRIFALKRDAGLLQSF